MEDMLDARYHAAGLVEVHTDRIVMALAHSLSKHGPITEDMLRAAGILCEEAGEVMAEALKMTNPAGTGSHRGATGTPEAMLWELAQVAATAVAIIDVLERRLHDGA
jgi:hypothetical protein